MVGYASRVPNCPACGSASTTVVQRHSVDAAATHLVPPVRDPRRHALLRRALLELWGSDHVAIRTCGDCGFGFADPYVAATPTIYNLISVGQTSYPRDRFEFGVAIQLMAQQSQPLRVLEIGAGDGAFMRKAHDAGVVRKSVTAEYDDGALAKLARIPDNQTFKGGVYELAATEPEPFQAVCMFQVLEHMDRLSDVFSGLARLAAPEAYVFVSVPDSVRTATQEKLTGFWDMPPNHIGRWTREALASVASRAGFAVVDEQLEPARAVHEIWSLAKYRWEARAYEAGSVGARVNGISDRRIRGVLKRSLGVWDFLMLSGHLGRVPAQTRLFRLRSRTRPRLLLGTL